MDGVYNSWSVLAVFILLGEVQVLGAIRRGACVIGKRKLTDAQVGEIRAYVARQKWEGWGWPGAIQEMADDYNVSHSTISRVVNGHPPYIRQNYQMFLADK